MLPSSALYSQLIFQHLYFSIPRSLRLLDTCKYIFDAYAMHKNVFYVVGTARGRQRIWAEVYELGPKKNNKKNWAVVVR